MNNSLIVAFDFPTRAPADVLLKQLNPALCRIKIGKEMFTRYGPALVESCMHEGFEVFLDLKFHDIPNTVAGACRAAADLGVWMVNVHASGGRRMLDAAREALEQANSSTLLIAVTVLTSLAADELAEIGFRDSPEKTVFQLAQMAQAAGLSGVVCSPREAQVLRSALGQDFLLVTPGVRPLGADTDDQRRVMTPLEALQAGASYLVIGRPITGAPDPLQALLAIHQNMYGEA
jgi:orotidine-5'-phosphate decarboxylase